MRSCWMNWHGHQNDLVLLGLSVVQVHRPEKMSKVPLRLRHHWLKTRWSSWRATKQQHQMESTHSIRTLMSHIWLRICRRGGVAWRYMFCTCLSGVRVWVGMRRTEIWIIDYWLSSLPVVSSSGDSRTELYQVHQLKHFVTRPEHTLPDSLANSASATVAGHAYAGVKCQTQAVVDSRWG